MHDAISNMLTCIQFNIVYQRIDKFYDVKDALTEGGYAIAYIAYIYIAMNIFKILD